MLKNMKNFWEKITCPHPKIGLALGSGGARGIAHIGVLHSLDELGYRIVALAGSSMGAIISAIYAYEPSWKTVEEKLLNYLIQNRDKLDEFEIFKNATDVKKFRLKSIRSSFYKFRMYSKLLNDTHILKQDILRDFISSVIPDKNIENAEIPLAIVTYDLIGAREAVFTSGSVIDAVVASSSIPGIFPPVEHNGMLLVDGGAISPVPVNAVKSICSKRIFAVDVSPPSPKIPKCENGMDIMMRVIDGNNQKLKQLELSGADKIITPEIAGLQWWRFEYFNTIEKRGYNAAMSVLEKN